jgi:hypothetical protein
VTGVHPHEVEQRECRAAGKAPGRTEIRQDVFVVHDDCSAEGDPDDCGHGHGHSGVRLQHPLCKQRAGQSIGDVTEGRKRDDDPLVESSVSRIARVREQPPSNGIALTSSWLEADAPEYISLAAKGAPTYP